jgi:hypothetical protein
MLSYSASSASAATLYSDDFNADTSANYNKFITNGASAGPSGDATFAYQYGTAPGAGGLSIPIAPHTTDATTIGLRLRTDNLQNAAAAAVVGATEIVTKNLSLPSSYKISVDVWQNYIGGTNINSSGSNGTTGVAIGIGTAGTGLQYIAGNDGLLMEGFAEDGAGANQSYRIYTNNAHPNPTTKPYWAAGTGASSATFSDAYYTSLLPSVAAPGGQSSFAAATQGGSTKAGTLGFAWHTWTITNDSKNVVWAIDGKTFTTVPVADFTMAGSQVSLGNNDTGTGGNTTANGQLLNAEIFDNFVINDFPAVPEPTSAALLALGIATVGLATRRPRRVA